MVAENSKIAANALNQKIDANQSLNYAKEMTIGGLITVGSMVKIGFGTLGGWFGMKPAQQQDPDPIQEQQNEQTDHVNIEELQATTSGLTLEQQQKKGEQVDDNGFLQPK